MPSTRQDIDFTNAAKTILEIYDKIEIPLREDVYIDPLYYCLHHLDREVAGEFWNTKLTVIAGS